MTSSNFFWAFSKEFLAISNVFYYFIGGVDYDDFDAEEEYLPRSRGGTTPAHGRPSRRGRGRGRPIGGKTREVELQGKFCFWFFLVPLNLSQIILIL